MPDPVNRIRQVSEPVLDPVDMCLTMNALFRSGLDRISESIGFHATSLEALQRILETGVLPGAAVPHTDTTGSCIYFLPRKEKFPEHPLRTKFESDDRALYRLGISEAPHNAECHYLLDKLGLPWNDPILRSDIYLLFGDIRKGDSDWHRIVKSIEDRGIDRNRIIKEYEEAQKRRGVILLLGPGILDYAKPQDGDWPGWDLRVHVPNGIQLKDILGIESVGEVEYNWLDRLGEVPK